MSSVEFGNNSLGDSPILKAQLANFSANCPADFQEGAQPNAKVDFKDKVWVGEGMMSTCYKVTTPAGIRAMIVPNSNLDKGDKLEAVKSLVRSASFLAFAHSKGPSSHIEPRGELVLAQNARFTELFFGDMTRKEVRNGDFSKKYDLFAQSLVAVKQALDAYIYHLDLKPENFFLRQAPDGSFHPVLGDFGDALWLPEVKSGLSDKIWAKEIVDSNIWGSFQGKVSNRIEIVSGSYPSPRLISTKKGNFEERINNIRDRLLHKKEMSDFNHKYTRLRDDLEKEMVFQMGMMALSTMIPNEYQSFFEGDLRIEEVRLIAPDKLTLKLQERGLQQGQCAMIISALADQPAKRPDIARLMRAFPRVTV